MRLKRNRRKQRGGKRNPRLIQPGAPPGTLPVDPTLQRPIIRVFAYGPDSFVEQTIENVSQVREFVGKWPVTWVNVDGLGDVNVLKELAAIFGIHKLALEDVLTLDQRAKVEVYGDKLFMVARMAEWKDGLETEQISFWIGKDFVVTFQEAFGDCLDHIRTRIRTHGGRIRNAGADYGAYCLLDALVDNYFPILERYGERLEVIEDEVLAHPTQQVVARIHEIKRDLLTLRRAMWPMREAISILLRDSTPVITPETRIYLRDCYDHTIQILELGELYRELETSLMEVYLSSVSNRLNEVMKVLTIISTIFIPLTFIVGVYGMNFRHMPELETAWGYPLLMLIMGAIATAMLIFFYRKGWLGSLDARRKTIARREHGEEIVRK